MFRFLYSPGSDDAIKIEQRQATSSYGSRFGRQAPAAEYALSWRAPTTAAWSLWRRLRFLCGCRIGNGMFDGMFDGLRRLRRLCRRLRWQARNLRWDVAEAFNRQHQELDTGVTRIVDFYQPKKLAGFGSRSGDHWRDRRGGWRDP
jgi:hypothetical protein